MFDLVLNTPFICNANQLTLSKFFPNRLLKSENMFKLYAQKISTKYNKSCFFEKRIHAKFIILKGKLDLNDLTCPGLWRIIFQSSYHTSLVSRKQEIDETVNFQNFWKCLQINWPRFKLPRRHPIFKRKNETKWQGTWSMLQWLSVVH